NITLIHAENGVGKTALLNAIKWCFFEETTLNFSQKDNLLNNYAHDDGDNTYYVAIEFEEDGEYFYCERGYNDISKNYFKMTRDDFETGVKPINDPELFINSILPKEMSEYFLFQGEGVGSFTKAKVGNNREVKEAIQNILGVKTDQEGIDELGDIKKDYRKEVATRNKGSELAKLSEEISKLEQEKIAKDSRLSLCDKNIGM